MVTRIVWIAALAALSITLSSHAGANEPLIAEKGFPGKFSANVALTSEYYFRGIAQTVDRPAIQGGFDYETGIGKGLDFYAGTWASNVNFDDANIEIDYYGGVRGSVGKVGWDVGTIYYSYPGSASGLDYNFIEAAFGLNYDFGVAATSVTLNYSPDNFGASGDAVYLAGGVDVPLGKHFTLSGHVGRQWIDDNAAFGAPDYVDYSVGIATNVLGFDLDLTWTDTDIDGCDDACGAVLFTVSRSF